MNFLLRIGALGCLIGLLVAFSAQAVFVEERLDDPALEARAQHISEGIRCLVCQNQSILDSNADLAKDLRKIVRERILLGESDDQVRSFLVTRYGDWVLLDPPFKLRTVFLWFGPLFIFFGGGIAVFFFMRGRSQNRLGDQPEKLTASEKAELDKLLHPDESGQA